MGTLTLVVGGQKSGKSSTAARLAAATGGRVVVVAPATASDEEMAERVARHRRDRPEGWETVETFDLVAAVGGAGEAACVVIDALDTWLAHAMGVAGLWTDKDVAPLGAEGHAAAGEVLADVDRLVELARGRAGETIVIAGQPGLGLHPTSANGRRYVDLHGLALQRLGAAGRVLQVVAGQAWQVPAAGPVARCAPAAAEVTPGNGVARLVARVQPVDEVARTAASRRHDDLAKPPGSLGVVEALGAQLAAIAGRCPAPVPGTPALLLAAADHGVHAEHVTAWPQEVTAAIVRAACEGKAASAVLASSQGVRVAVLDVGLAHDPGDHPVLLRYAPRGGTRNLALTAAMTPAEARAAVVAGASAAEALVDGGADLLLLGDMGLANTTASACLVAALTGTPAEEVTGRGAGADDQTLRRKIEVVRGAVARITATAPLEVLAEVGGFEHAALVGAMLAGAARRVPVVLDGVVTNAAALVAVALQPAVRGYLVAAHRSVEPGAARALEHLDLRALLDLDLRLGEGSGALLAAPLVRSAAAVLAGTALLDDLL